MEMSAVATASSVLSSALSAMKYVREVSDVSDDLELKSRINDLYTALLDVRSKVLDLDEENRHLKAELSRKADIVGPDAKFGYFFFKDKPTEPLCPKCYQSVPSKVVNMGPRDQRTGGMMRFCPVCNYRVIEEVRQQEQHQQSSHGPDGWME